MRISSPRVSIGLPVYNGERYIRETLDSILAQTYSDFELIISDNASTDQTESICRSYLTKDPRIRYYRNKENRGAAWNFNYVFQLSSGEYFKWAAHDDICAPDFLLRCVEALDRDPFVVLSYPRTIDIDSEGNMLTERNFKLHGESSRPYERFRYQICVNHWCFHIFGLIRANALRTTRLIGTYVASDRVLLAHLALLGPFHEVPYKLFYHRQHPSRSTKMFRTLQSRAGWFNPAREGRLVFPNWRLFIEYLMLTCRSRLSLYDRMLCHFQLLRWLKGYWRSMIGDVEFATRKLLISHEH